uniref:Spermatogenesis associated 22 n=1 Tax=Neogobius melanostomus TaxID=47308 RepID=A0A8C6US11_9GOBI
MKRQENPLTFPTVPLFNQKKRSRVPLTSAPPANESYSFNGYMNNSSTAAHPPYNKALKMGQTNLSVRQLDSEAGLNPKFNQYQMNNRNGQGSSVPSPMYQQPSHKPPKAAYQFSQQVAHQPSPAQVPTRPTSHAGQQQSKAWNFTNSFGPQPPTPPTFQMKPVNEISLRILTAVIDGMRHWSQFKDKAPHLFELFGQWDYSGLAVTLGPHGAKNFLIRDGKEVSSEKELPRLIRGQVHRCVGNYDRSRNVLVCVSIRPALPSELRNAQEAVRVCDAEMRALVKTFSEV